MSTTRPARVVIVDDEPDDQRAIFRDASAAGTAFEVLHPDEVEEGSLDDADLVLVDYIIDNWPARAAGSQIGLKPANGIAGCDRGMMLFVVGR